MRQHFFIFSFIFSSVFLYFSKIVADSLDAATDKIGRCYANGISFSELVQQLFDGSGTRYAPYVTDLFHNPDFYRYLENHLPNWRQDAYYEAYLSSGTEDTLTF